MSGCVRDNEVKYKVTESLESEVKSVHREAVQEQGEIVLHAGALDIFAEQQPTPTSISRAVSISVVIRMLSLLNVKW